MSTCYCGKTVFKDSKDYLKYPKDTAEYLFSHNCYDCAVEIADNSDFGGVAVECSKKHCTNYCDDLYVDIQDRENYPAYFGCLDENHNPLCGDCFEEYDELVEL